MIPQGWDCPVILSLLQSKQKFPWNSLIWRTSYKVHIFSLNVNRKEACYSRDIKSQFCLRERNVSTPPWNQCTFLEIQLSCVHRQRHQRLLISLIWGVSENHHPSQTYHSFLSIEVGSLQIPEVKNPRALLPEQFFCHSGRMQCIL